MQATFMIQATCINSITHLKSGDKRKLFSTGLSKLRLFLWALDEGLFDATLKTVPVVSLIVIGAVIYPLL